MFRAARVGTGEPWWRSGMLTQSVLLKMASTSTCVATSFSCAGEWTPLVVDHVHVLSKIEFLGEPKATGDALERALLKVDALAVTLQMTGVGERTLTIHIWACLLYTSPSPRD